MNKDNQEFVNSLLQRLAKLNYIKPGDVPNIDLYMDQVTTFMEEQLSSTKRYEDDKILTKTMINNYAKNNLLPPPNKKKLWIRNLTWKVSMKKSVRWKKAGSESCRIVFVRRMRLLRILLYVWMMKKENSFRSLPLSVISVLMCM
mgnify:CR=1 FL=1